MTYRPSNGANLKFAFWQVYCDKLCSYVSKCMLVPKT